MCGSISGYGCGIFELCDAHTYICMHYSTSVYRVSSKYPMQESLCFENTWLKNTHLMSEKLGSQQNFELTGIFKLSCIRIKGISPVVTVKLPDNQLAIQGDNACYKRILQQECLSSLLWFWQSCSSTLSTGGHFEPAPSIHWKYMYYHTFKEILRQVENILTCSNLTQSTVFPWIGHTQPTCIFSSTDLGSELFEGMSCSKAWVIQRHMLFNWDYTEHVYMFITSTPKSVWQMQIKIVLNESTSRVGFIAHWFGLRI